MDDELQFANIKLDEQTMTKTIAYLVIQVSNLQKENADNINRIHELEEEIDKEYIEKVYYKAKIDKTMDKLKIKQARLINEKDYVITDLDLDEIMQDLESKGE